MSFLSFGLMAEMWFDQEKLDVRMTPRHLTAATFFIAFPLIIRGTSGRVGSLFLEKVGSSISGSSGTGSCQNPTQKLYLYFPGQGDSELETE